MTTLLTLQPAAAATFAKWHEMVAAQDLSNLPTLLVEDAKFRSPAVFKPYSGAPVVNLILNTVLQVFEEFSYHRQFATPDGLNVVLEFNAKVGDKAAARIGVDQYVLRLDIAMDHATLVRVCQRARHFRHGATHVVERHLRADDT